MGGGLDTTRGGGRSVSDYQTTCIAVLLRRVCNVSKK